MLNVFASLSENDLLLQITKPLFVPVFIMYYYIKNRYIFVLFIMFFVLSFIGDFSSVFPSSNSLFKFSSFVYFLSYLTLIIYSISKFKRIRIDLVVATYLLVVVSINAYFLYELFGILKTQISDITEVNLFAAKSISLIVLAFISFVIYLNSDTKQSILFLFTTLCFVFSDVLHYISNYYIYNWSFVMLDHVLHVVGLFFLFNYIIGENRLRKKQLVMERLTNETNETETETAYILTRQ
jgi:hypothetical protein